MSADVIDLDEARRRRAWRRFAALALAAGVAWWFLQRERESGAHG